MYDGVRKWKYTLISADYRLAPQVAIQEIFEDVEDCIKFVRDPQGLAALLPANTMDSTRLAVSGSGGGGYLALLAGLHITPKPGVVLAISPISDPLGLFFTIPHPWVHWDEFEEDDMPVGIAESLLAPSLDPNGEAVAYHVDDSLADGNPWRHLLYKYALHRANLGDLLHLGSTPNAQRDPANDKWRIAKQLDVRELPPTYIFHGTADDQVDLFSWFDRPVGYEHGVDDMEDDSEHDSEDQCQKDDEREVEEEGDEDHEEDDEKCGEKDGEQGEEWDIEEEIEGDGADDSEDDNDDTSPISQYMNRMYNFMHSYV
ncbi:hypothetical protein MBLNU13_g01187t2 [Cladosporium sp. NU13]